MLGGDAQAHSKLISFRWLGTFEGQLISVDERPTLILLTIDHVDVIAVSRYLNTCPIQIDRLAKIRCSSSNRSSTWTFENSCQLSLISTTQMGCMLCYGKPN